MLDHKLVVGHVDHGIRGAESTADSEWVGKLAGQLGLDYEAISVDLSGDHSEASARESRYAALIDVAVDATGYSDQLKAMRG